MEDLLKASKLLVQALEVRERYMKVSYQDFPSMVTRFLRNAKSSLHTTNEEDEEPQATRATLEGDLHRQS